MKNHTNVNNSTTPETIEKYAHIQNPWNLRKIFMQVLLNFETINFYVIKLVTSSDNHVIYG